MASDLRFLHQKNISLSLRERIIDFFEIQWYYDRGLGRKSLVRSAPPYLLSEVKGAELKNALTKVPLFQFTDADFLLLIAESSEVKLIPSEEIVSYAGDVSREMIIVLNGHCNVLSSTKNVIKSCEPEEAFGVLEMLYGIPKYYTLQTVTNCKIMIVDFRSFERIINMFPLIEEEIKIMMNDLDILNAITVLKNTAAHTSGGQVKKKHRLRIVSVMSKLSSKLRSSFICTILQCGRSQGKEKYWKPFKKMGRLWILGYLMMPLTIHPAGLFLKLWCALRIMAITLSCTLGPYYIAVAPYANNFYWIFILTDISAYIDIYLLMHVAYYNANGILVTHPQLTAANYLKKSFALDVIGVFPIKLIIQGDINPYQSIDGLNIIVDLHKIQKNTYRSWHLNVALQFHRITELFSYLEENLLRTTYFTTYLKFIPVIVIIINIISSLVFVLNCNYHLASSILEDYYDIAVSYNNTKYYGYLKCTKDNWLKKTTFYASGRNPRSVYLIIVYWITDTITGVGIGNVTPSNRINMYIIIFTIILGRLMFAYGCAGLINGRLQLTSTLTIYQENLKYLLSFLKKESVDVHWQKKIYKYYLYVWKRTLGSDPQKLCKILHAALMEDTITYLYEKTLREVPLFENVEKSFIRVLSRHLVEEYFLKGDTIIKYQDVHNKIYIIFRGKVEVMSSCNEMIACMGPGGLFGNIGQINAGCSSTSLVASSNLDVLVIPSEKFYTVLEDYPRIKTIMINLLKNVTDYVVPSTIIEDDFSNDSVDFSLDTDNSSLKDSIGTYVTDQTQMRGASIATSSTQHSDLRGNQTLPTLRIFLPHKWFHFVLLPDNYIFKITEILLVVISYYDFCILTYMFATLCKDVLVLYCVFGLEIIFYFKILLNFHEAYPNKYGIYITQPRVIITNYLTNYKRMLWDIIPNFPIELFCFLFPRDNRIFVLHALRLLHILRMKYVQEYFYQTNKQLMSNKSIKQVFKALVWITTFIHIYSCIWIMLSCPFLKCIPGTWIVKNRLQSLDDFELYITAVYYVTSLTTATGVGDLYSRTLTELCFSIFVDITSRILTMFVIAELIKIVIVYMNSLSIYEYNVQCLQDFLKIQNLSEHQMEKLKYYLKNFWKYDKGQHMPIMITNCSYVLKCNIMNVLYGFHIRKCYLFKDLNEALIRQLTVRLERMVFFKGNYIVQHGDTDQNMYFIHSGKVSVLTVHSNLTETEHEILKEGEVFGLAQGLDHGIPHHFSFRAKTKACILVLNLDSWRYMLKYFANDEVLIYYRTQSLYKKT